MDGGEDCFWGESNLGTLAVFIEFSMRTYDASAPWASPLTGDGTVE